MQTTTGKVINQLRLNERIEQLSQIGRIAETGVCRLALTPEDMDGIIQVRLWMENAGLTSVHCWVLWQRQVHRSFQQAAGRRLRFCRH